MSGNSQLLVGVIIFSKVIVVLALKGWKIVSWEFRVSKEILIV